MLKIIISIDLNQINGLIDMNQKLS